MLYPFTSLRSSLFVLTLFPMALTAWIYFFGLTLLIKKNVQYRSEETLITIKGPREHHNTF